MTSGNDLANLGAALDHELSDTEIEEALKSEEIYAWGPDGERFERMFQVVMRLRQSRLDELGDEG